MGSRLHTQSTTAGSSQPTEPLSWQQPPSHVPQSSGQVVQSSSSVASSHTPSPQSGQYAPQLSLAAPAQAASHATEQQLGSVAQTHAAMAGSEHPGVGPAVQQSPWQGPQSAGHPRQVSPPEQAPSPHDGSQLAPHVPVARLAQAAVHSEPQQEGSTPHTHAATSASLQPGVPFPAQQVPGHAPQSEGHPSQVSPPAHCPSPHSSQVAPHTVFASAAQGPSHSFSLQ
jgi:hypothetical protein